MTFYVTDTAATSARSDVEALGPAFNLCRFRARRRAVADRLIPVRGYRRLATEEGQSRTGQFFILAEMLPLFIHPFCSIQHIDV